MIRIKPHHFMDIMKLHGAGLDIFVPDMKMGHDFYKIGNEILSDKESLISLTVEGDDICVPCKCFQDGSCGDDLTGIEGFSKKDSYNKMLDYTLVNLVPLNMEKVYTAYELCEVLYLRRKVIYEVWNRETEDKMEERFRLFEMGCRKYACQEKTLDSHLPL